MKPLYDSETRWILEPVRGWGYYEGLQGFRSVMVGPVMQAFKKIIVYGGCRGEWSGSSKGV